MSSSPLPITVQGPSQQPLTGVSVTLYSRGPGNVQRRETGITDANGRVQLPIVNGFTAAAVVAVPKDSFWTVVRRGPVSAAIVCPPLPTAGPEGWWHEALGIRPATDSKLGAGIKVGIIDTGCGPNQALSHVTLVGAFIAGARLGPSATTDVQGHGTHTAGIIGARPINSNHYSGIAPDAELFAMRVFPPNEGASQADIASAIDVLSQEHKCDLLNLSLGSTKKSEVLKDAIRDALARGTLCVCAAGNDGGPLNYPAAYEDCVAVTAIGLAGWGPVSALSSTRLPVRREFYGQDNYYLANFSSTGAGVACAAPGVGIISTVPASNERTAPYAVMDGTSMASPAACGALAALLARDASYSSLPRDITRAHAARALLLRKCRSIGLVSEYEGRGIPFA
jgi:subtilisin